MSRKAERNPAVAILRTVILEELKDLGAYVYHDSHGTTSCYIKFRDPRLRSLTIRDHRGKVKYKYKWNLVVGYDGPQEKVEQGTKRFFYGGVQFKALITHIRKYKNAIDRNASQQVAQDGN